jgi:hypothetical protein
MSSVLIAVAYLTLIYRAASSLNLTTGIDHVLVGPFAKCWVSEKEIDGYWDDYETDHGDNPELKKEAERQARFVKGKEKLQAFLSLVFIELIFLALRLHAFFRYRVPIGVLFLKNLQGVLQDVATLNPKFSLAEKEMPPMCVAWAECTRTDHAHFEKYTHPRCVLAKLPDGHKHKRYDDYKEAIEDSRAVERV